MKFFDKVNVSDSRVRGFVTMTRLSDGHVMFKKENTIVENGRRYILSKFITSLPGFATEGTMHAATVLDTMKFGKNGSVTNSSMTNLVSPIIDSTTTISQSNIIYNDTEIYVKFTAELDLSSSDSGYQVEEFGLFIGEGATLFSRIVFDPIIVAPGEKYEIEYYLYF
jgi:uncharacterized cupredoxin-like copper-binding protein